MTGWMQVGAAHDAISTRLLTFVWGGLAGALAILFVPFVGQVLCMMGECHVRCGKHRLGVKVSI
jgi:hypothetical protein